MLFVGLAMSGCAPADLSTDTDASASGGGEAAAARELAASASGAQSVPDDAALIIDAETALQVAEEVVDLYRPYAAARSATITIVPRWDSLGGIYGAEIRGVRGWTLVPKGPFLNQYLTRDVVRMATCHELGHLFGGFPFRTGLLAGERPTSDISNLGTHMAAEGQADYFATKNCVRRVWAGNPDNAAFRDLVPPEGKRRCDIVWEDQDSRDICYRSIFIARDMVNWLRDTDTRVDINTPDPKVRDTTDTGHPASAQIRYDTLVAGALCDPVRGDDPTTIPGLVPSPITGMYGHHSVASENDSRDHACYEGFGARPLSWFKPDMPEHDCGNGVGWVRCADDATQLVVCTPPLGEQRYGCSMGCVSYQDPWTGEMTDGCAEDIPPGEGS
ncbi:hypothetical protein WMF31_03065 [Sorangium sp. So ce1036]|uniref:hypothetical protein n=1 Tax=Sorangium sp. So ce1036 TaxID=3133328 RepID=UPI003F095C9A